MLVVNRSSEVQTGIRALPSRLKTDALPEFRAIKEPTLRDHKPRASDIADVVERVSVKRSSKLCTRSHFTVVAAASPPDVRQGDALPSRAL